ncbi:MAG: Naphthalene 1,2-dioxygenase/salicylate 5-hydroxylase system, ferredoxin component [Candidatus Omnitrophica bacterium]|nr:Naphthalene 1,2-dioxygenase/salicylate 5-hydroxylase system, ferredoxin component [Candidatus Omnitrophota bacterium]
MSWVRLAKTGDLEPGGKGCITSVHNQEIALFRTADGYHAVQNSCPHRGAPLGQGHLDGQDVLCPWHGWTFNVKTGQCVTTPGMDLKTYPVRVEGENVMVDVPEVL